MDADSVIDNIAMAAELNGKHSNNGMSRSKIVSVANDRHSSVMDGHKHGQKRSVGDLKRRRHVTTQSHEAVPDGPIQADSANVPENWSTEKANVAKNDTCPTSSSNVHPGQV